MKKRKSIRIRLLEVYVVIMLLVFAINMYIVHSQSQAIRQIDGVYNSNIQLNDISTTLEKMQTSLYQYLNTKSSDELENYYLYEQDYRNLISELNEETVNDQNLLMEKNIRNMSDTYLEKTAGAIEAKRGRNVSCYNEEYSKAKKLYDYLDNNPECMSAPVDYTNDVRVIAGLDNFISINNAVDIDLFGQVNSVGFSMFLLTVSMLVALAWIVMMTRTITRPLIKLAEAANTIAKGGLEVDFPIIDTGDEISTVAKACNKMMNSIRDYIRQTKENYERESRLIENELIMKNDLKEAQLKYLQAQINPHFLFNSLNAAAQLAMMEGAENTCLFVQNMADFFRYNVRKMEKDTTLKEELELVDNYIYILNVRFAGEIHYTKQIDERVTGTMMPSMILQPLIENAVNHGIRELQGEGKIHLSVYSDDGMVCVKVEDNGVGIEPEVIEKIMRGESAHSHSQRDSAGIGMDNVINRLKRYYNMEHVIEIRRREERGTEVLIYLKREDIR